ncbi:MAG: hypothetical protein JJ975_05570 [Bacteroidia bacterium]|nr:hypothetical protein [Bacteroidia bacterium]
MTLSEVKEKLQTVGQVRFVLPDGSPVPQHFHVTEVGKVSKHFIDCGGVVRTENKANFQLWQANDYDHRLAPNKLVDIIQLSERVLGLEDLEVEVEYQSNTIGRYNLEFDQGNFFLKSTQTACLAPNQCGVPAAKQRVSLSELGGKEKSNCSPDSGCC